MRETKVAAKAVAEVEAAAGERGREVLLVLVLVLVAIVAVPLRTSLGRQQHHQALVGQERN
jgi:hypothetical protein